MPSGLTSRLVIAIPGIAVAVAVVAIGGVVFALAMAVIAALGLRELYSLTAAQRPLRWAGDVGVFLTIALAWGMDDHEHGLLLGLVIGFFLVVIAGLIVPRRDEITIRMTTTLLGIVYLGVPFAITFDKALESADKAALFKTFIKVLAQRNNMMATFMAKWSRDWPGQSGHIHLSLKDAGGKPVFHDPSQPHGMSQTMRYFVGGLQKLMPELLAMVSPTINSYTRLIPGFWAPTDSTWGVENRTCALRVIPGSAKSQRVEYRVAAADAASSRPSTNCNPSSIRKWPNPCQSALSSSPFRTSCARIRASMVTRNASASCAGCSSLRSSTTKTRNSNS